MTYSAGNTILASDFNSFHNDVEDIFEDNNNDSVSAGALIFGYGETLLQAEVSVGNSINAAHWNNLYMMIHRCAGHQGTSITLGGNVSAGPRTAGDTVTADSQLATAITAVRNNKLSVDAGETTTGAVNNKSGTASWTASTTHTFTQTFANYNAARYYFNQGGNMQFSASRSGGSGTTQNSDWATLLSAIGTITMKVNTTTQSGSGGTTGDSFDDIVGNASTTRTIFTQASSGVYSANNYKIQCSCNAAKVIYTWTITFTDGHTNSPWSDSVDGTLSSNVSSRRANGTYINSDAPSYSAGSFSQS
jgi:hypothetical protein